MPFIVYKQPYKGRRAQTISRDKALKLQAALQAPQDVTDPVQRAYLENIRQLAIAPLTEPLRVSDSTGQQPLSEAEQVPLAYKDSE